MSTEGQFGCFRGTELLGQDDKKVRAILSLIAGLFSVIGAVIRLKEALLVALHFMYGRQALAGAGFDMQVVACLTCFFRVYNGDLVVRTGLAQEGAGLSVLSASRFLECGLLEGVWNAEDTDIEGDSPSQVRSRLISHAVGVAHAAGLELFVKVQDQRACSQVAYALTDGQT